MLGQRRIQYEASVGPALVLFGYYIRVRQCNPERLPKKSFRQLPVAQCKHSLLVFHSHERPACDDVESRCLT